MASPALVGFLGFGDCSLELAASLRRSGYAVQAFSPKMDDTSINQFLKLGGTRCSNAIEVGKAMCEKLYVFEDEIGAGSKIKMLVDVLEGIHLVASVEASSLGVQAGIHPWIIYDIISNAAWNSWIIKNDVQKWLKGDHMNSDSLDSIVEKLVWERVLEVKVEEAAKKECYLPEQIAHQIITKSKAVHRVGFIGLGAMGFGMATHLLRSNFAVVGYDVYQPTLDRFFKAGGLVANSPAEASEGVDVLIIMVTNEAQAESGLFGNGGAVPALPAGASVILSSTVSPAYMSRLEQRLLEAGKNFKLVDAPVSGGVQRASMGTLTV